MLFDVLSLVNTWQAFRVQCIPSVRYTDIHELSFTSHRR